jgi:hypothetical protein
MPRTLASKTIRSLAADLRKSNKVWEGKGRRPVDEQRPTLIQELHRITHLSRDVLHRALSGRSRSGSMAVRNRGSKSVKISVADIVADGLKGSAVPLTTRPIVGNRASILTPSFQGVAAFPSDPVVPEETSPLSAQGPIPGARGLEAIGLRISPPSGMRPSVGVAPPISPKGPTGAVPTKSAAIEARRALQDGLDWFLADGYPPPALRELLEKVEKLLSLMP